MVIIQPNEQAPLIRIPSHGKKRRKEEEEFPLYGKATFVIVLFAGIIFSPFMSMESDQSRDIITATKDGMVCKCGYDKGSYSMDCFFHPQIEEDELKQLNPLTFSLNYIFGQIICHTHGQGESFAGVGETIVNSILGGFSDYSHEGFKAEGLPKSSLPEGTSTTAPATTTISGMCYFDLEVLVFIVDSVRSGMIGKPGPELNSRHGPFNIRRPCYLRCEGGRELDTEGADCVEWCTNDGGEERKPRHGWITKLGNESTLTYEEAIVKQYSHLSHMYCFSGRHLMIWLQAAYEAGKAKAAGEINVVVR